MKKLTVLSLIVISFLFSFNRTVKLLNNTANAQGTIDTLSYFLIDNENQELTDNNNQNNISQRTIGQAKFVVKWRMPQQHEYFIWDDNYIYLHYDHTCCGDNPPTFTGPDSYGFTEVAGKGGRWLKRQMAVGESFTVNIPNGLTWYKADCSIYSYANLHYVNTLEAYYPSYNLGAYLGTDELIILRSDSFAGDGTHTEKFYFSKKYGWVKWQFFINGVSQNEVTWTKISMGSVAPLPKCASFPTVTPTPCPTLGNPENLQVSCMPTLARLSWSAAPNSSYYSVRIDDKIDPFNGSCSPPDSCTDTPNTWYDFPFTSGHNYRWWIHSRNSCGDWGNPIYGPDFTCPPATTTLSFTARLGGISVSGVTKALEITFESPSQTKSYTFTAISQTNGLFSVSSLPLDGLTLGTFTIYIKDKTEGNYRANHLRKSMGSITISSGQNSAPASWGTDSNFFLKPGDITGDNAVTLNDIARMLSVYTQNSIAVTAANKVNDIDGNNIINLNDILLAIGTFTDFRVSGD